MNHMTVDRWVDLALFMYIYMQMLICVRIPVIWEIRLKAIELIGANDDPDWYKYLDGLNGWNMQLISIHKWEFKDFYPDLARFESYLQGRK